MPLVTSPRWRSALKRVDAMFSDKWRLERLLGIGGMGAVYEARHRNGSRAAIKVLHPDVACSAHERERFRREAYVANRVEHPAVVRVLDDGVSDGEPYLVMELVDGEPLDALSANPLGESELLDVAEQVLDALVVAHARGVIHRDIKPQNLLLDRSRRVRILDFGLAHMMDEPTTVPGADVGTIAGTIDYMAPEQIAGESATPRSDLYSLGVMLFRLVSGEHLHEGSNVVDQMRRIVCEPPRSLSTVNRRLDPNLVALVDRATSPSVAERWPNAEQMRREVRRIRATLPPCTWDLGRSARSEQPTMRMRTPAPIPVPAALRLAKANRPQPAEERESSRIIALGAALLTVLLLLIAARAVGAP
ncbi:MAG: serine/threonine-protein kinase [Polyangiales bacterium]